MSIRLRSLGAASRHFINHLNHAISMTVTRKPLTLAVEGNEANIRFRNGSEGSSATIQTRFGRMELYLGHVCISEIGSDGNHLLKTMQYRYMLTPDDHSEPRIRWEYVGYPIDDDMHCRHHLQGPIPLNLSDEQNRQVTLNDLHLPTGWVPVGRCCASVSLILE
jgi:hypothetical protein